MNFKKLSLIPLLWLLNACYAETPVTLPAHQTAPLPPLTPAIPPARLAEHEKLAHADCFIGLQHNKHFYPTRWCQQNHQMRVVATAPEIAVLPDSRPILFQNHILILGEPDNTSYPHGVLGDAIEAKTLYTLDANTLKPSAKAFRLPHNLVFENNTITLWGNKVVAVISGDGMGARVAVLSLSQGNWHIQAQSQPLPLNRWQSPFVFADKLYAVQMPHLRGCLVEYTIQNQQLIEQTISEGLSNHAMGSHDTQIAAILPDYALIPQMGYRHLYALHRSGQLQKLEPSLPAKIIRSMVLEEQSFWLLADGSVWTWKAN